MTDLRTLHDAFHALEQRSDAVFADGDDAALSAFPSARYTQTTQTSRTTHSTSNAQRHTSWLVPASAAAAVMAVTAGGVLWRHEQSNGSAGGPPATTTVAAPTSESHSSSLPSGPASNTPAPNTPAATSSALGPARTITPQLSYSPAESLPPTSAALADRARKLLAGLATIDLATATAATTASTGQGPRTTAAHESAQPQLDFRPAIAGTLTAHNRTGGFTLTAFRGPGGRGTCAATMSCSVQAVAKGTLVIGNWKDPRVPGGVTDHVEIVRPDGADVVLQLSTERDPKGASSVLAPTLPLSRQEMVDFVTSEGW